MRFYNSLLVEVFSCELLSYSKASYFFFVFSQMRKIGVLQLKAVDFPERVSST